jgi:hypothetical protein
MIYIEDVIFLKKTMRWDEFIGKKALRDFAADELT